MADLKPCPFCGGEAELRHHEDFNKDFSSVYKFYVQCKGCEVQSMPTANVERATNAWNTRKPMEAVIAELEKKAEEYNKKADRYSVYADYFMRYLSIAKGIETAISIVRGKERKYCGNCKHQPEPLTTCDWLKSQTVVFKECPRWERKE